MAHISTVAHSCLPLANVGLVPKVAIGEYPTLFAQGRNGLCKAGDQVSLHPRHSSPASLVANKDSRGRGVRKIATGWREVSGPSVRRSQGWCGGWRTRSRYTATSRMVTSGERLASRRQGELNVNLSVSFDWFPIQGIGFVAPLFDGILCRLDQQGRAAYHLQASHGSIFPN